MDKAQPQKVTVSVELELSQRERDWLSQLFGVGLEIDGSFDELLGRLGRAAMSEWIDQFLERADVTGKVERNSQDLWIKFPA